MTARVPVALKRAPTVDLTLGDVTYKLAARLRVAVLAASSPTCWADCSAGTGPGVVTCHQAKATSSAKADPNGSHRLPRG